MYKKMIILKLKQILTIISILSFVIPLYSQENQIAPDFSLQNFNGNKFILSAELKNSKAILLWFTNLCKGCEMKIPGMEKIKSLYEKNGIKIVAVSVLGKDRETVENAIQQNKITFRFLFDPKGKATKLFSGKYHPGTCPLKNIFVIEKYEKIVFADHYPGTEELEIEEALEKIIGGRKK